MAELDSSKQKSPGSGFVVYWTQFASPPDCLCTHLSPCPTSLKDFLRRALTNCNNSSYTSGWDRCTTCLHSGCQPSQKKERPPPKGGEKHPLVQVWVPAAFFQAEESQMFQPFLQIFSECFPHRIPPEIWQAKLSRGSLIASFQASSLGGVEAAKSLGEGGRGDGLPPPPSSLCTLCTRGSSACSLRGQATPPNSWLGPMSRGQKKGKTAARHSPGEG